MKKSRSIKSNFLNGTNFFLPFFKLLIKPSRQIPNYVNQTGFVTSLILLVTFAAVSSLLFVTILEQHLYTSFSMMEAVVFYFSTPLLLIVFIPLIQFILNHKSISFSQIVNAAAVTVLPLLTGSILAAILCFIRAQTALFILLFFGLLSIMYLDVAISAVQKKENHSLFCAPIILVAIFACNYFIRVWLTG